MLNKKTVVNLTGNAMNEVYGGALNTDDECITFDSICGPFPTECISACYVCTDTCDCTNGCTFGCTREACVNRQIEL